MNEKIIIIDNDVDTLEVMAYILIENGYEVIAGSNSVPLMNLAAQNPALIILDHWLDTEYGDEICLKLKSFSATSHIPIMLVSATPDLKHTATLCKADAFLAKPFDIDAFTQIVKQLVQAPLAS